MKFTNEQRSALLVIAVLSLLMFWGGTCSSGSTTPGAYSYNTAISTMGGTYTSNVIPINYFVSVTTNKEGTVPLAPGFGDVYSLVEYSTNNGVRYDLCHNTAGHPGDYFSFLEAPSTQEATFNWDVDSDLGPGADVSSCILRVRVFHAGDNPCSSPAMDIETSQEFSIDLGGEESVCGEPPAITTESVPDADDEVPYSFTFDASGGYGTLTWSLGTPLDSNMISGLSLSPIGVLAGTPIVQDEYKGLNVQLDLDVWTTDECPDGARSDNGVYTLTIYPQEPVCAAPPEFYSDQGMPNGREEEDYTYTLQVSGGEGSLFFEIVAGALPDGLILGSGNGVIDGHIEVDMQGTYPLTFRVTDSCYRPQTDEISLELVVDPEILCGLAPQIINMEIADGTVGVPYSETFTAAGGFYPLFWSYTGVLPAGLDLVDNVLSGTPTEAGTFNPTIIVTDSCVLGSRSDSVEFPFTIYEETPECADPPSITNSPDDG
ncbi:MAG: Ig domain-containing protein, partial [bacterium]